MSASILKGQIAVVTGGSGTIGKAITKRLLKLGSNVYITGRNKDRLEGVVNEINSEAYCGKIFSYAGDVTDEKSVADLFDTIEASHPENSNGCQLLVNNAGINAKTGQPEDLSVKEFSHVMDVNVLGPFLCSREAIKRMKSKNTSGRIINIGSISAISPRPVSAPYTTSKFALLGLTQSLHIDAREFNIAVGIIHPGNVMSSMITPQMEKERGFEGFMDVDDLAGCVSQMASLPHSTNVFEMTVMPNKQPLVGRG